MITFAADDDREQLKKIWKICFGDEDNLTDAFLDACEFKNVLVYRDSGVPVAALYMIPMNKGKTVYFYALATLPRYRRKGIMSSLIAKALGYCKKSGADYAFLIPAEENLVKYYYNQGFRDSARLLYPQSNLVVLDNVLIENFTINEEKNEAAETPLELYGTQNSLVCVLNGNAPSEIGGHIPF